MAKVYSIPDRYKKQLYQDGETWKRVVGFEHDYAVSNFGRVMRIKTGRILKPAHTKLGYQNLSLPDKNHWVHILVANAFLGEPPEGMVVNHIDNNPSNNRLENLEYTTRSGNTRHAMMQGRLGVYKYSAEQMQSVVTLLMQDNPILTIREVAELTGVTFHMVASISVGRSTFANLLGFKREARRNMRGTK